MIKNLIKKTNLESVCEASFRFKKKHCEAKTYKRLRNMLLEKGYKPLSNIIYNYSFDYKITKPSNKTKFNYPYTIYVTYPNKPTLLNQYYLAA